MTEATESLTPACVVHTFGETDRLIVAATPLAETTVFRPERKQILVGIVFSGRLTLRVGTSSLAVAAGHCFLHRSPGNIAEWSARGDGAIFLAIEGRPLAERFARPCTDPQGSTSCLCCSRSTVAFDRVHPAPAALRRLGRRLLAAPDGSIRQQLRLKTATLELWLALLELEHSHCPKRDIHRDAAVSCTDRMRIERIAAHLAANLEEKHSLDSLCRQFALNECKLKHQFKLCLGDTVFGHLRTLRLEHSRSLLSSGEFNVTEVALAVGYSNPSHFAAAYAARFGQTPRQARHTDLSPPPSS